LTDVLIILTVFMFLCINKIKLKDDGPDQVFNFTNFCFADDVTLVSNEILLELLKNVETVENKNWAKSK